MNNKYPIPISIFYIFILSVLFQISVNAQPNFVEFNTIPKSGTALILAHMDDDLIWMLPFWNISEKFIGGAMPSTPTFETIVHQQQLFMDNNEFNINYEANWITPWGDIAQDEYVQYYWGNYASYNYLADDHLVAFWDNADLPLVRKEINRIKAKLEQYIAATDVSRIITHNNWGEYGHQHHKALNIAVRELAVKYRKDVWISDFYFEGNVPDEIKYTLGSFNTPDLYTGIRSIYEANQCWTWHPTLVPSGDHKFIKIVETGIDRSDILTGESITTPGPIQNEPGAYIFDGVDNYMTLPGNNNPSFTIAMRVRPDQIKSMDISKMTEFPSSTVFDRSFYMRNDGKITAHIFDSGSKSVTSTSSLSSGDWSHLVMSGNGNTLKIYINGILEGSVNISSTFTSFNSPEFVLGQKQETADFFKGQIKDVSFFDYTLSDEEIALMAGTTPMETFTIIADAGIGGTINPTGVNIVQKGLNRTYNISPDFGYLIQDVKVDNISVGAVAQYTFTNILANHTIAVTFSSLANLALNKPTTSQSSELNYESSKANDSDGSNNSYWSATPYPRWWQVDLGDIYDVSYISIRNYVGDNRYYQYNIEASIDGNTYTQIGSKTNNNIATDAGDKYTVSSTARFLRVNVTYNSTNPGSHISDFKVFGTMNGKINLSISGLTAVDKAYDGTTEVTLNTGSAVLVGIYGGDVVSLNSSGAIGTFVNKNVGTNKEVITSGFILSGADAGKYYLTQPSVTADISAIPSTVSGVAANNKVYDGTTLATINDESAIITGILEGDNVNLDVSAAQGTFLNKNVGNGKTVNISGLDIYGNDAGNYIISTSATTTANITKRPVTVTSDSESKIYGEYDPALNYQITSGNLAGTDTFTGALTRDAGENIGSYAITKGTLALSSNYELSYISSILNINARSVTIKADSRSKIYGNSDPALTYHITSGSLAGTDAFTGALTRTAGENVGTYAITKGTVALNSNYILSYSGANLIINARSVTITADSKSKIYGDSDPALTYHVTSGSIVGTDAFTGTLTRTAGENVGTYAITKGTVALNSNYILSYSGANFIINPRSVIIMADAKSKEYGESDPVLTFISDPAVGSTLSKGEPISFTGTLSRVPGETVGTYAILKNTLNNSNYSITYIGSNLTINLGTEIKPVPKSEFGVKAYPNPFTDHLYFDLQWNNNAKARIEIFNIGGIKLATIFSENIEANQIYRLEYTPEDIKTGILFYRLFINGNLIFTDKLIHKE